MKHFLTTVVLLFVTTIMVNGSDSVPQVSVTATGEISVKPNVLLWDCTIKTTAADLSQATQQHTTRMQTALAYLQNSGVAEKDLQTTRMNFRENWNFKAGQRVKNGYIATSSINFKITDFDKYNELWSGLSKIEGLSVNNVNYDHTDKKTLQKECLKKALLNAKERAAFISETLDEKIGRVLKVSESGGNDHPRPMQASSFARSNNNQQPAIAPGEITISKRVNATFMLLQ